MTFDLKDNHFKYQILPVLNVPPVMSSDIFRHVLLSIFKSRWERFEDRGVE